MSYIDKLSQIRKEAYMEYLNTKYKMANDRTMFTDEKERIVKSAYKKYKEVEAMVDEAETLYELEEAYRDMKQNICI